MDHDNSGGESSTTAKKKSTIVLSTTSGYRKKTSLSQNVTYVCIYFQSKLKIFWQWNNMQPLLGIFLSPKKSKDKDLITAFEVTSNFHGITSSYSQNCGHKLNAALFCYSAIAKKCQSGQKRAVLLKMC